ncbi:hypothetical protein ACFLXY_03370, partial [Chloroflexota bacterium]
MMEITELHHSTLGVLREIYMRYRKDLYHQQIYGDLNAHDIIYDVALNTFKEERWKPSKSIPKEDRDNVGIAFPIEDKMTIISILWKFVSLGMLVPRSIGDEDHQSFLFTTYGAEVLSEEEESPYDPYGFLNSIKNNCNFESESFDFIEEAVKCFLAGYMRSSMVMIGLTSENEILNLIERYSATLKSDEKKSFEKKIESSKNLKTKFEELYRRLENVK